MKTKKHYLAILFTCSLFAFNLFAQESSTLNSTQEVELLDLVILKNGQQFTGKLVEIEMDSLWSLKLEDGSSIELHKSEIEKFEKTQKISPEDIPVIDATQSGIPRKELIYAFKERGIYATLSFGTLIGVAEESAGTEPLIGVSISASSGYRFNRLLAVGVGLAIDFYNVEDCQNCSAGETIYPIFTEARGYLLQKKVSPFYSVASGYGFAFNSKSYNIIESRGGVYFHPAVGLRMGADKDVNVEMDIGYKIQDAFFKVDDIEEEVVRERDILFNRLCFRIGIIF